MKKKREKKVIIKSVLYIVIVFVLFTLITLINFGLDWAEKTYGTVPFSQLVFHLKVPLKGTSNTITGDFRKNAGFTDEEREKMTRLLNSGFIQILLQEI